MNGVARVRVQQGSVDWMLTRNDTCLKGFDTFVFDDLGALFLANESPPRHQSAVWGGTTSEAAESATWHMEEVTVRQHFCWNLF